MTAYVELNIILYKIYGVDFNIVPFFVNKMKDVYGSILKN